MTRAMSDLSEVERRFHSARYCFRQIKVAHMGDGTYVLALGYPHSEPVGTATTDEELLAFVKAHAERVVEERPAPSRAAKIDVSDLDLTELLKGL